MSLVNAVVDLQTGNIYSGEVEDSGVGRLRHPRLSQRIARKQARLARLQAMQDGGVDDSDDDDMPVARTQLVDSYRLAGAANLIQENHFDGLGSLALTASPGANSFGTLSDQMNRTFWIKSVIMDSDDPASVLVTAITIAGMPTQLGSKGIPMSAWSRDSTRFSQIIGRSAINVGQTFAINVTNIDTGSGHTVSAGIFGDELQPGIAQQATEKVLIEAALALVDVGGAYARR